jgi:hypothetical protein
MVHISLVTGIKISVIMSNILFWKTLHTPARAIVKTKRFFAGTAIYRLLCIQATQPIYN